ncbi:hypothetical protein [Botrimarina sp.]|uniref:hypothetical protein n=1 Tax=Botrimarina sp. TaxID=2795802 RepID=UPI0032ECF8B6
MSTSLLKRLDETAARLRAVARWSVVVWTLAAALTLAGTLALVDWLGRFNDPGLRWLFSAVLVLATAAAGSYAWRRLRPRGASRLGVAERLQQITPGLGSRLASAVEFAASDPADRGAGSAELRRAVVLDATRESVTLRYDAVVDRTPLRHGLRWLAGAVALIALLAAADSSALSRGLWRLAAPWSHAPWPREVALRVVEAPTLLARGDAFEAVAVNDRGPLPDDVRIEYRFAAGEDSAARTDTGPAQLVGDQAVATRDEVRRSFAYRFVGGDDDTMEWIRLRVLDPPAAKSYSVTITPPSYSGLPEGQSAGPVPALEGSRLGFSGTVDKPIEAAAVVLPSGDEIALAVSEDQGTVRFAGPGESHVALAPDGRPVKGEYQVRLAGASGISGVVGPHPWAIAPDTPPEAAWASSDGERVTAEALVPVVGTASDNLAIAKIELLWAPTDADEQADPERLTITDNGPTPPARRSLDEGDQTPVDYVWDLSELALEEGAELSLWLAATDYRGAEGRTPSPRRLQIVSDEEFLADLAAEQSRLLGQVQQALATQREAASSSRALEADTREAALIDRAALDRLTATEFQQREATATVADPSRGAAETAQRLLEELDRSRVEAADLRKQLTAASEGLRSLADQTMPSARGELADARRAGRRASEGDQGAAEDFKQRLAAGLTLQGEAVDRLERVADLLTSWADYQRFATEAAALEELQRELSAESQQQAAAAATAGRLAPPAAEQEKLLTRQAEASRRFEKLRSAMQRLLDNQPEGAQPTAGADAVGDALAEAEEAAVASRMRDAARDIARNRAGAAAQNQSRAAEGLKSMVEALRERTTTDPEELIARLEQEKQRLEDLQEQVGRLAERPDSRQTDAARQQAADRAARQGRRLERLTASQAAASTQQGAQQTAGQPPQSSSGQQNSGQQNPQSGDKKNQLQQAQQSFDQAQQEIDQRIDELEDQQTQRVLQQLAERIDGYIQRQEAVLDETIELDNRRNAASPDAGVEQAAQTVGRDQSELAQELGEFATKLAKRAVFELALGGAQQQGAEAARRLDEARVGKPTQRREAAALARLEQIKEVLEQTPQLPEEPQQQQQGGGQGGQGGERPPSPIDVAELKMLRMMQMEVLTETDEYEADTATARRTESPLPEGWGEQGAELAVRQKRLAELALELAERDNDPEAGSP